MKRSASIETVTRRSYEQFCALARGLDVVGERWTLLIVRELLAGQRRYSDIQAALPGIGTSLLAERLKHLEREGVITRSYLPPPAASTVYELTEDGRDLGEALMPLIRWGARRLGRPKRGESINVAWMVRFMEAMTDARLSEGVREVYEIRFPEGSFHVQVDDGTLRFAEGPASGAPDLIVETDIATFVALGRGDATREDKRKVKVTGAKDAAARALLILGSAAQRAPSDS